MKQKDGNTKQHVYVYQSGSKLWMEVEVVAKRPQTVTDVLVAVQQLIATCRIDSHVTSGPVNVATVTVVRTVLLYKPRDVLH